MPNIILILIAQHEVYGVDHLLNYKLGNKPLNSIWLTFFHLKTYLDKNKLSYFSININNKDYESNLYNKEFNYCISIFNDINGFNKKNIDNYEIINNLKQTLKCKFFLLTEILSEQNFNKISEYFDFIFTNRRTEFKNSISLGFAANETILKPSKDSKLLNILIDHTAYNKKHFLTKDKTKFIIQEIFKNKFDKQFVVKRFINSKIETVIDVNCEIEQYNRVGVNILEAYHEYNKADIFFVTHPESMGLSVIECAMAGCLIVSPKNYIKPEFLANINHIEFENILDWSQILKKINFKKSRKLALNKTWSIFYNKMFTQINKY